MNFRGSGSPYCVEILQGVGKWIRVLSIGRCVILCAFLVKVSNIYFLVEKYILNKKTMFTIFSRHFNVTVT